MVKKIKLQTWKPLQIDGAAFNDGVEGLIGIEECTDYDLNRFKQKARKRKVDTSPDRDAQKLDKKTKVKKTGSKRQHDDLDLTPSKQGSTSEIESSADKKNVKILYDDIDLDIVKSWTSVPLPISLLKALALQNFSEPTQIQSLTLPAAILGKRDILGAAETGSGKTLAFGLPILTGILQLKEQGSDKCSNLNDTKKLSRNVEEGIEENSGDDSDFEETEEMLSELNEQGIGCVKSINNVKMTEETITKPLYALILTPTRELAIQIRNHLLAAAKFTDINVAVVVGGMAVVKQERILKKGPEIVVATPGRLWELIQEGNPHLSQIDDVKYLAIDETDRMIEKGHFQELEHILERINMDEEKKKNRQNFVFSATLTLVHELPKHLLTKKKIKYKGKISDMTPVQKLQRIVQTLGITNPKVVDITQAKGTSGTLTECRITCTIDEKDYYVYYFLQRHSGRTLIFCNSIGCVRRLATIFGLLGCNPLPLHASMQQRQRLKNLDRFKENENGLLIATDVAARGLDIPCVEHVIHYQTPRTSESYIHRSGRTARASRQGITVLLVEPNELQNYLRICRTLEKGDDIPAFPVQANMLNAVKKRVNLARELDKLELQLRKTNSEAGWMQKLADDMDMILDEEACKYDKSESHVYKKAAEFRRKELSLLLAKPVFPTGFSCKYPLSSGGLDIHLVQGQQQGDKAVDVMKSTLEKNEKIRREKPKILFKPKIVKTSGSLNLKSHMKQMQHRTKKINRSNKQRKKSKIVKR